MYLYHFGLRKLPFSLTPDTELFCSLPSYKEALNTIHFALTTGEAFCLVSGEVGTGKTMLSRWLINKISEQRTIAYLPNPVLSPREIKLALASELNIRITKNLTDDQLVPRIQKRLIELNKKHGPVVLIIDEAQTMPDETLEALRLFTNLETETSKLLQIVLFAQPELIEKLNQKHLRQLRQRIAFQYRLSRFNRIETQQYIEHRINRSTSQKGRSFFSSSAYSAIFYASGGIPRLVNILAHKSLMLAFGKGRRKVRINEVLGAINDTQDANSNLRFIKRLFLAGGLVLFSSSALAYWVLL